jgi:hypothetical protein
MNIGRRPSHVSSKFLATYDQLFQGFTPEQINPNEDPRDFFSNLLVLDVDRNYVEGRLNQLPKGLCLDGLKVRVQHVVLPAYHDLPALVSTV